MIQALQISALEGAAPAVANPVAYTTGYYYDETTGDRYYLYTDPVTGITDWYKYSVSALGYVYAQSTIPAPKTIQVMVGDRVRVYASFSYRGDAFSGKLHAGASMGSPLWIETFKSDATLSLPKCTSVTPFTDRYADLIVPSGASQGYYYIYLKITDGVSLVLGKTLTPWYENALEVIGVTPEFSAFEIDFSKITVV